MDNNFNPNIENVKWNKIWNITFLKLITLCSDSTPKFEQINIGVVF